MFIDGQGKYLEEVERLCAQHGLDFAGIHCTESSSSLIPEFDSAKEKMEFNILREKHVWLFEPEFGELL